MPKDLFEIKGFHEGIKGSVSSEDITDNSATYSKNLDCVTRDGGLLGVKADTDESASGLTTERVKKAFRINDDIIGFTSAGKLMVADEDSLSFTNPNNNTAGGLPATGANHNNELHLGMGTSPPKWVGKSYDAVNSNSATEYSVMDAELKPPSKEIFSNYYTKVITLDKDTTYYYAAVTGTSTIYRIHKTTGAVDSHEVLDTSLNFTVQDICECVSMSNAGETFIWAFSKGNAIDSDPGEFHLLDASNFGTGTFEVPGYQVCSMGYREYHDPDYSGTDYAADIN